MMAAFQVRWRVECAGDSILYKPVFGKSKEYRFSDITKVKVLPQSLQAIVLYSGAKRMFMVDYLSSNYRILLGRLRHVPFI